MPVSDASIHGAIVQITHFIGQLVGHSGCIHEGLEYLAVVVDQLANALALSLPMPVC